MTKQITYFTLLFTTIFSGSIVAQQKITWQQNIGGQEMDNAKSICESDENGTIAAGYSYSDDGILSENFGWEDAWVISSNANGFVNWKKNIGGNGADVLESVITDNGFIVAAGWTSSKNGVFSSNKGVEDGLVVKLTQEGDIIWQKVIGGSSSDKLFKITNTNDGGYICTGYSHSSDFGLENNHGMLDFWVLKLSNDGHIEWQNSYGGSDDDYSKDIIQLSNGNYAIIGSSNSIDGDVLGNYGEWDIWIIQISPTGALISQQLFGNISNDEGIGIGELSNGYIVAMGVSNSETDNAIGKSDAWVIMLNNYGEEIWNKKIGGTFDDQMNSLYISNDNTLLMSGFTFSTEGNLHQNLGNADGWILEMSDSGDILWETTVGGTSRDAINAAIYRSNNGIAIAGYSYSNDGDINFNNGSSDFWLFELDGTNSVFDETSITLYPNPATNELNVVFPSLKEASVTIINAAGQIVFTVSNQNWNFSKIDISNLPQGFYYMNVIGIDASQTKSFIKI